VPETIPKPAGLSCVNCALPAAQEVKRRIKVITLSSLNDLIFCRFIFDPLYFGLKFDTMKKVLYALLFSAYTM